MSKISENIRAAALGPKPRFINSLAHWLRDADDKTWRAAADLCRTKSIANGYLHGADEAQARTFLLLVAEAVK